MKKQILKFSLPLLILVASAFTLVEKQSVADDYKGLREYFSKYFIMGVAVSPRSLKTDEAGLILKNFGGITAENAMKMGPLHPREDTYNWNDADSIMAFAERNQLKLRGHNLCWHNQAPRWFFTKANGDTVTKEELLLRLKEHITTVVNRYKGRIYAWDVVNEAISDKPEEFYRPSVFYRICGEDFIAKAFEYAHAADPDALLFYNDYNEINPVKREKIIRMIKDLKKKGVPIHGVGLQAHWAVNEPSEEQLDKTLKEFTSLGLNVQITELDISVYPKEHNARATKPEDTNTAFTAEREQQQIDAYKRCFTAFMKYRKKISSITFWNISDRYSWLDNFPVRNRKDYPLLFDKNLEPKKAFEAVVATAK
jgi:endo-1,4-beta-xylanase